MNDTTTQPGGEASPERPRPAATAHGRSRRLRAGLLAGLVLLVGAGAFLSYVGWEYYGTDIISQRRHEQISEELRQSWKYPTVGGVLGPGAVPSLGTATALVRIPRFGSDYEVPVIEGVRDEDLSQGIGHFAGAGPGQIGNFALTGYQATHGQPFSGLSRLQAGDEVVVETVDATYTYQVDTRADDLAVPLSETWVIDQVPMAPAGAEPPGMPTFRSQEPRRAIITLTTCSELFHTDTRQVVFGHLVAIESQ